MLLGKFKISLWKVNKVAYKNYKENMLGKQTRDMTFVKSNSLNLKS